jgi:hypothetical protein
LFFHGQHGVDGSAFDLFAVDGVERCLLVALIGLSTGGEIGQHTGRDDEGCANDDRGGRRDLCFTVEFVETFDAAPLELISTFE